MTSSPLRVPVELSARSYDILVGADLFFNQDLHDVTRGRKCVIVTDERVAQLHLPSLQKALPNAASILLPPGEGTKNFDQLESLCGQLLDHKVTRQDIVIAFGGGVIGDLTGFAAAILRRGVDFIQIPTTLLAQVDSSVGGKTAINMAQGKNLIGAFYQPRLVLADIGLLETLPQREVMAGFAEVVKYGLINDAPFFEWLEASGQAVLKGDQEARSYAIARSCENKAAVVAADEREEGQRALLNLGHTFGHAIEAHGGYDGRILHGEAVSIGMTMAHKVSARLGHMPSQELEHVLRVFKALNMPMDVNKYLSGLTPDIMIEHMAQDKKNIDNRIALVLTEGIGEAFLTRDVERDILRPILADILGT